MMSILSYSFQLCCLALLFSILYLFVTACLKRSETKKRISNYRIKQKQAIDPLKIIIAIQPLNIFVDISNRYRNGYHEIVLQHSGLKAYQAYIERCFGHGIYYKIKQQKKNIVSFVQTLATNPKIQICLYTKLQKKVVDVILKRLQISKYFNQNNRIYSAQDQSKHPTDVDSLTKRVIILTGSKKQFTEQDSKYFMVIKNKQLKQYNFILMNLLSNNRNIDELHTQLNDKKIEIQSDYDYDSSHYD